MTFQTIPINITGPSYQDRSRPLSAQETRNFYQEVVESGKDKYVTKSFPGLTELSSPGIDNDRGMHSMGGVAYRVLGRGLHKVESDGSHTRLGDILGGKRCIFADDGINLFIVADSKVTQYNSTTGTVSQVTNVNITGAQSVAFINNQFAYTFPAYTVFSDAGDGSSASGLNAIGEESHPDDMVRDYAFDQILYRAGKETIASWYNSGVGSPPFDKIEGQTIGVGLGAIHSMANSKEYVYWLGSDSQVYRARGGQEQLMSTAAISGEIQGYDIADDAYANMFTMDNKTIYALTFPSENKTWALIEELGQSGWFELSSGVNMSMYNGSSILNIYNKILVGDDYNGKIYELSFNSYDEAGSPWLRRRVISTVNGDMLGQKGKRVQMSRMEIILESGTGLTTGQGENPRIMIEASYDGGRSWVTGTWVKTGRLGQYTLKAEWFSLKSFYEMVVRMTTTDPVAFNLYTASIDLRLAGR